MCPCVPVRDSQDRERTLQITGSSPVLIGHFTGITPPTPSSRRSPGKLPSSKPKTKTIIQRHKQPPPSSRHPTNTITMNAQTIVRASRNLTRSSRLFSTSVRTMAEGDVGSGSSRPGGMAQGDAFSKREKANEDQYVRQQELMK